MSNADFWTVVHGIFFGGAFLLGFGAGFVALFDLRAAWTTAELQRVRARRLPVFAWIMAISLWATVLIGTFLVYPAYRASPPEGTTELSAYPRSFLLSDPELSSWHHFGMEWKEHIAWLAPILATAVAFVITRYRYHLAHNEEVRKAVIRIYLLAFAAAGVAGLLGALINKAAPIP